MTTKEDIDLSIYKKNDVRGVYLKQITPERAVRIGSYIGMHLKPTGTVIIGGDSRLTTPVIKQAIITGLLAVGATVIDIGLCTTPTTYFAAAHNPEVNLSIMITASHNPIDHTGLKVSDGTGMAYEYESLFKHLKSYDAQQVNAYNNVQNLGSTLPDKKHYVNQYLKYLHDSYTGRKDLNIAVEYGHGAASIFQQVLSKLTKNTLALHDVPDGNFPALLPDPVKEKTYAFLQKTLRENTGYDLGIAFDGDGDRVGFTTGKGKRIPADQVSMLLGEQVARTQQNPTILIDVKTSLAVKTHLESLGATIEFTKVGHSWVHKTLLEKKASFAAELSGHYYYATNGYYGFDDALYSALRMMEYVSTLTIPLEEKLQSLPSFYSTPEIRVHTTEEIRDQAVQNAKSLAEELGAHLILLDGVRAELNDGWFLVRPSGTETLISYRVESKTEKGLHELKTLVESILQV